MRGSRLFCSARHPYLRSTSPARLLPSCISARLDSPAQASSHRRAPTPRAARPLLTPRRGCRVRPAAANHTHLAGATPAQPPGSAPNSQASLAAPASFTAITTSELSAHVSCPPACTPVHVAPVKHPRVAGGDAALSVSRLRRRFPCERRQVSAGTLYAGAAPPSPSSSSSTLLHRYMSLRMHMHNLWSK